MFKGAQLVSAAALSFGHGANDAQKTMGVIAALLVGAGYTSAAPDGSIIVPDWVAISAYFVIALGTLWGGWRVIETMGMKITKLHANTGAAANIGANVAVFGATTAGIPISTTHATATSVIGAGIGSKQGANWNVVRGMVTAWLITIPSTAAIGFIMYQLTQLNGVLAWISVGLVVVLSGAWTIRAMLNTIGADDVAAEVDALDLTTDFVDLDTDRDADPATAVDDAAAGDRQDRDDELVTA